jgi:hypothetical protein
MAAHEPDWAGWISEFFELSKPGYMKRFVVCHTADDAVTLGSLAHMAGCRIQRIALRYNTVTRPVVHYYLPDDTAQATLEIIAYYTGNHHEGDHMRGRLTL